MFQLVECVQPFLFQQHILQRETICTNSLFSPSHFHTSPVKETLSSTGSRGLRQEMQEMLKKRQKLRLKPVFHVGKRFLKVYMMICI